ncbi:hypothetical protein GETHPA_03510 [Geothrix rubra]|uniref:Uncharacterized protein n=1 Tax=Geothrix rubra TaxID=2927977 RepID=A0ABQ5Q2S0_9BACT|nr:hypothetical protein [Geothrix rubra]GLH68818.1 hypothetical protein GETHPA_03510 [Geothrix rubra]
MAIDRDPMARAFLGCLGLAFFAAGIPWWLAPYNRFSFSTPPAILGTLAFLGVAAWASGWTRLGLSKATVAAGAAVPLAVMARVIVDTLRDPTSHNLWPLEVVMMAVLGFGVAFAAALAGRLLRRVLGAP